MKFKVGEEYQTRGGVKAKVYAIHEGQDYPIHGAVHLEGRGFIPAAWSENGVDITTIGNTLLNAPSLLSLMPRKRTVYFNLYRREHQDKTWVCFWTMSHTASDAKNCEQQSWPGVETLAMAVPIEIEE